MTFHCKCEWINISGSRFFFSDTQSSISIFGKNYLAHFWNWVFRFGLCVCVCGKIELKRKWLFNGIEMKVIATRFAHHQHVVTNFNWGKTNIELQTLNKSSQQLAVAIHKCSTSIESERYFFHLVKSFACFSFLYRLKKKQPQQQQQLPFKYYFDSQINSIGY